MKKERVLSKETTKGCPEVLMTNPFVYNSMFTICAMSCDNNLCILLTLLFLKYYGDL